MFHQFENTKWLVARNPCGGERSRSLARKSKTVFTTFRGVSQEKPFTRMDLIATVDDRIRRNSSSINIGGFVRNLKVLQSTGDASSTRFYRIIIFVLILSNF